MDEKELEKLSKNLKKELKGEKRDMKKMERNLFLFIFLVALTGIIVMWFLPH